jgi:plasmid maintenance system antidote protein VapI
MKSTENFKQVISNYLESVAANDSLFSETLKKDNKNIDGCVNYILQTVQKSGCTGFADEEIFAMAVHYYDEDDIGVKGNVNCKVVVNHIVELTEEDKTLAKEKAMKLAIEGAKAEAKKNLSETIELSEEDLQDAKKQAIDKIATDQKEKLVTKATKKKQVPEVEQIGLFD